MIETIISITYFAVLEAVSRIFILVLHFPASHKLQLQESKYHY